MEKTGEVIVSREKSNHMRNIKEVFTTIMCRVLQIEKCHEGPWRKEEPGLVETVDHPNYCLVAAQGGVLHVIALLLSLHGTDGRLGLNSSLEECAW